MERTQPDPIDEVRHLPAAGADRTVVPDHTPHTRFTYYSADNTAALVQTMLCEIASRLETVRPDEPITAIGRIAMIQATTMDPTFSRALHVMVPEITGQLVRRNLAARLREIAGETP